MSTDPYAAPRATVADTPATGDSDYIEGGQALPAGAGWDWLAQGWKLFMQQPGTWIGFFVVFSLIFVVAGMIPVVSIATVIFYPAMTAGMFIACRRLEEGKGLRLEYMFEGFKEKFGPLVVVGALYLGGTFAIVLVVALVFGIAIGVSGLSGMFSGGGSEMGMLVGLGILLFALVVLALFLPLIMAIWFAPPLVVFHGREPVAALKESFWGCMKNIVPFLVYGVIAMLLTIVATLPLLLGWLVLGPVLMGSYYASYKTIFTRSS